MSSDNEYRIFAGGKHHAPKYNDNPIYKSLISGFMDSLLAMAKQAGKSRIFEIGCGEGQLLGVLNDNGYEISGMDLDEESVQMSRDNLDTVIENGHSLISQGNLYDISKDDDRIAGKMLICCEVLEHVPDPELGVKLISECTDEYFIVSVPHEPIWCMLNMARGKYIKSFGNTPGHINHWTRRSFVKLVSKYADIIDVRTPLPWTMVLARTRL